MTGKRESANQCPFCGGRLQEGKATVPFVLQNSVAVVKDVPAQICADCHEPLMTGAVTDELTALLRQLRAAGSESRWSPTKGSSNLFLRSQRSEQSTVRSEV